MKPTRRRPAKGAPLPRSTASVALPTQAARPAQLRLSNKLLLLHLLRMNSPCSKADLVRMSGLTAPTVSMVAATLIKDGLVEELGEGTSSGGRPPAMLRFNGQYGFVAGVDIGGTRVRMMLADLNGKSVAEWNTHMEEQQKTPRGVVDLVRKGLDHMVTQAGVPGRVLHLTAGAPGITDVKRGVVLAAPNLAGWNDVPLRMLLERELSISVEVENDTNLAAVGEHAEGVAGGVDNFVFLAMGTGVGAGIYLRGALHQGATWSAGEVGYLPVTGAPRQRIQMRETGQLERVIGGLGIEARWKTLLRQAGANHPDDLLELRAPQIFDLAENGDQRAEEILQSTARILADALSMMALMYNPELIVMGGGVGSHRALCSATTQYLQDNDFALPVLRSSSLGTRAQLFGAVSVSIAAAEQKLLN
ncbi:MAG: ROK family protein [Janthinobacterium lividum]